MFLNIVTYPDKILRNKSQEIKEVDQEVKDLALNMIETMKKSDGVGLAGSQVGINKRIVVIGWEDNDIVLINPVVTKKSILKCVEKEGCLSFPELELEIKRPKKVTVQAIDYSGKKIKIDAEGLLARILQHEIDHINGILIIDKANKKQKDDYSKKLNEILTD